MEWVKRFCAVSAYLRRVREFNRTTKGTRIATTRRTAGITYDRGGQKALDQLVTGMVEMGRRDEKFLATMEPQQLDKGDGMSEIEKLDQHTCEAPKGRMSVERWTSHAPGGLISGKTEIHWWLISGSTGGGKILFCPYCGIKLDESVISGTRTK